MLSVDRIPIHLFYFCGSELFEAQASAAELFGEAFEGDPLAHIHPPSRSQSAAADAYVSLVRLLVPSAARTYPHVPSRHSFPVTARSGWARATAGIAAGDLHTGPPIVLLHLLGQKHFGLLLPKEGVSHCASGKWTREARQYCS